MADVFTKTAYRCTACGYIQDFDPSNQDEVDKHYPGTPLGDCPICWRDRSQELAMAIADQPMIQTTLATDEEIELSQVEDQDINGDPIMIPSGQKRYRFNPITGVVDTVDIMVPQMRLRTTDEISALKSQRDQDRSAVESLVIQETAPTATQQQAPTQDQTISI